MRHALLALLLFAPSVRAECELDIARLQEKLGALETKVELQFDLEERARKIQAVETERRLEALNGEAQRLNAIRLETIRKETYEEFVRGYEKWREAVNNALANSASWGALWGGALAVIAITIASVGLFMRRRT